MAETETAKSMLENLSSLMTSIEAGNKPQTANIRLRGGLGFGRFVAILLMAIGIITSIAAFALMVTIMTGLPQSTSTSLRIIAATPSLGWLFGGLVLLGFGTIIKAVVDTADYHSQMLRLTRRRMEKR